MLLSNWILDEEQRARTAQRQAIAAQQEAEKWREAAVAAQVELAVLRAQSERRRIRRRLLR